MGISTISNSFAEYFLKKARISYPQNQSTRQYPYKACYIVIVNSSHLPSDFYQLEMGINSKGKKLTDPPIIFRMGLAKEEAMTEYNCCSNCYLRPAS